MDSRKVSSLSVKSDGSDTSLPRGSNLILEEIGNIPVTEATSPKSVTSSGSFICILTGDTHVFLAEVKLRADSDCVVTRRGVLALPGIKEEKKYLDAAIFQINSNEYRLCLLGERKNKERFVSIVEVQTSARVLALGEEQSSYDKASMLGKGVSNVAPLASPSKGEADLLVFSNIVRKLRVEDNGCVMKPTSGRVPIPPECMDGTITVSVAENKKGFTLVSAFRTKSAGKNKFQINWFAGRKDEISVPSGKSSLKLGEDQEPTVILGDPRDSRSAFLITINPGDSTSNLYKLIRGRKLEEPVATFAFAVRQAVFVMGPDKTLFLLLLNCQTQQMSVHHLTKTEGYRSIQATWNAAPEFQETTPCFFHAISCATNKWQIQSKMADYLTAGRSGYQMGLATLLNQKGDIATEPESGNPYRLRLLGGDNINDILVILLDDLERSFESEEEALSTMTLKVCMNGSPGREGLSQVSGWLMAGRLAAVEMSCTKLTADCPGGSDRLVFHTISADQFRSYVVEHDWTQTPRKEGTFVLDTGADSADSNLDTPHTIRTSTPSSRPASTRSHGSRIPSANHNRRSMNLDQTMHTSASLTASMNGSIHKSDLSAVISQVEEDVAPLARANAQIRDSLELLQQHLMHLRSVSAMEGSLTDSLLD